MKNTLTNAIPDIRIAARRHRLHLVFTLYFTQSEENPSVSLSFETEI